MKRKPTLGRGLRNVALAGVVAGLAVLSGCMIIGDHADQFRKRFYTAPVWIFDNAQGYKSHSAPSKLMNEDVNVALCISGGGARAAYFSACVLEELAKMPDPAGRKSSMLERVQVVSGSSGGSLSAFYYALYKPANLKASNGAAFFKDYKNQMAMDQVLNGIAHLENSIWEGGLYYYTRWRLSQSLAQMYDRRIFRGATLAQMHGRALRGEAPVVMVGATNLDTGGKFVFTPLSTKDTMSVSSKALAGQNDGLVSLAKILEKPINTATGFDTIDSEADNFRVAVAVAASCGLPMTPGPTTLVNYRTGGYVHLADGGINDNPALDSPTQLFLNAKAKGKGGRLVLISVDAMQGNKVSRLNDRDPDGYVGTLAYATNAFSTLQYRSQLYQKRLLESANSDIDLVEINLFGDSEAHDRLIGHIGVTVKPKEMKLIEAAAKKMVAQEAGKLRKAIGGQ